MYKRLATTAFTLAVLFSSICSATATETGEKLAAAKYAASEENTLANNPDEITTCLLPGKVRNLGSRMVYIAPRQQVSITRVECDIRGGEVIKG